MSNTQRKVVLIMGIILAPFIAFYGFQEDSALIVFGGPILSVGSGIYFWVGREKSGE